MGRTYYYFMATLPMLEFGMRPPFSEDGFLNDCRRLLSREDAREAEQVFLEAGEEGQPQNGFLRAWREWDSGLRNEAASAAGNDPSARLRGARSGDARVPERLGRAGRTSNLLDAEKEIDRLRWEKIDEMVSGHFFDIEAVLAYALKLRILHRYRVVESVKGSHMFDRLRGENLKRING